MILDLRTKSKEFISMQHKDLRRLDGEERTQLWWLFEPNPSSDRERKRLKTAFSGSR